MKTNKINGALASTTLAVILLANLSARAETAFMLQPVAASTTMGELYPATHAIDQSGLSLPYTSLVTDFDSYVGANPTATIGGANVWGAPQGVRSGNFDLSLGGAYLVSGLAFWNLGTSDASSVKDFNITVSSDPSFTSSTTYPGFLALNSIGTPSDSGVQVFTFTPTTASFVRISILDTWSSSSFAVAFNEVALRASPIPEPSLISLLGCGLFILMISSQVRQRANKIAAGPPPRP